MLHEKQIIIRDTDGNMTPLDCGRVLRSLPGRREVYEGRCGGQAAVIKLFSSRLHRWRHFRRELKGFEKLAQRGITTATILAKGHCEQGWILVLKKIENAADIFTLLKNCHRQSEKKQLLSEMLELLARMHMAGIVQEDLHLGNFLWDGKQVYALDPAQMRFFRQAVSEAQSLRQTARLMTNFQTFSQAEKKELLSIYFRLRGWEFDAVRLEQLETLARKITARIKQKAVSKTLRNSTHFARQKTTGLTGMFDRAVFSGTDLPEFMKTIDAAMEAGDILKRGNTCFVSRITFNERDIVVKRYNHKGLWHSLRYTVKGSRARKCWLYGHRLTISGIACAKPLAFIEQRKCGLKWQSYIINEFVDGPNIRQFLDAPNGPAGTKEKVMDKTQRLLRRLAENRMTHGDLKPPNVLVRDEEPVLIDLDSMQFHRCGFALRYYQRKMDHSISKGRLAWKQ